MKKIAILGSTGSIGTQTLDVIRAHSDELEVVALAAGSNKESVGDGGCRSIPPIKRHTEFLYAAGLRPSAIVILASSTTAITA